MFDPVGTRAVLAPMEPVIGEAVRYASNQDPNTRNAFQIAEAELGALLGEVDVDREAVFERLKAIRVRGVTLEESERIVRVASNVVLSYWRLLYETALAPEIGKSEAARLVLSSIREGIRQGLRD